MTCDCQVSTVPYTLCDDHRRVMHEATAEYSALHNAAQVALAVDAIQMTALSVAKIVHLSPSDVPRLLVSAANRGVERLIEYYDRHKGDEMPLNDQGKIKAEIVSTSADLHAVFTEGLATLTAIQESLT